MVELTIHAIASTTSEDRSMVLLKEKEGERILPILTSTRRAGLLLMRSRLPLPLPLPVSVADANFQLMQKFGVRVARVELTALKDGIFFSRIVGQRQTGTDANGEPQVEEHEVDFCQAPDGLVIAATAACPILIEEELLEAQYMHQTGANTFALNINTLSRQMLEDALQNAVATENYEAASHLRDELARRTPLADRE